jgi:hypothetical protein
MNMNLSYLILKHFKLIRSKIRLKNRDNFREMIKGRVKIKWKKENKRKKMEEISRRVQRERRNWIWRLK